MSEAKACLTVSKDQDPDRGKEPSTVTGNWSTEVETSPEALRRGLTLWTPGLQPGPWRGNDGDKAVERQCRRQGHGEAMTETLRLVLSAYLYL